MINKYINPKKENLNTYLTIGLIFISYSIIDVFLNSFFKINIT